MPRSTGSRYTEEFKAEPVQLARSSPERSIRQLAYELGILVPSMGRAGSACDNALAESFVATLKTELLYRSNWPTRQVMRTAIFEYIEGFYNTRRRHSALGHLSPAEFEEVRLKEQDAA